MSDEKKTFKKRKWHAPFIAALASYGSISTACSVTGIGRSTYYKETHHEEFRLMVVDAERQHRDLLLLKVTNLALKDGAATAPVALQALQWLVARADRRLADADRAGGEVPQVDRDDVLSIQITEAMAKKLWPLMRSLHQEDQNDRIDTENEPNDAKRKPN